MITLAKQAKVFITNNDSEGLIEYYTELRDNPTVDWQYLFKECYIHACLKKQREIVNWLTTIYETFDPISKIALRQVFPYGRYLLAR